MFEAILVAGLATGAVYAMIGLSYNIMYSTSKVMSFTSGQLGMVGAVLGAWFISVLGWPFWVGFPLAMAGAIHAADPASVPRRGLS